MMTELEKRPLIRSAQEGNTSARDILLREHLHLVMHRARRHHRSGAFLEMDDLVQQGNIGLLRALEKFDLERRSRDREVTFVTYATYWIEHSIRRTIQNHGRTVAVPVSAPKDFYQEIVSFDAIGSQQRSLEDETLFESRRHSDDAEHLICAEENVRRVRDLMGLLSERERGIIAQLFGLGEDQNPMSTEEVAQMLGVSATRVRQLRQNAIAKLKANMSH